MAVSMAACFLQHRSKNTSSIFFLIDDSFTTASYFLCCDNETENTDFSGSTFRADLFDLDEFLDMALLIIELPLCMLLYFDAIILD